MKFKDYRSLITNSDAKTTQNEVFDNPYDWNEDAMDFNWLDENGDEYSMTIFPASIGLELDASDVSVKIKQLSNKQGINIDFSKNGDFGMSKSNAFRVFATVKEIFDHEAGGIERYPYVAFSAKSSDRGRVKFYDTLAKYVKKTLKFNHIEKVNFNMGTFDSTMYLIYK